MENVVSRPGRKGPLCGTEVSAPIQQGKRRGIQTSIATLTRLSNASGATTTPNSNYHKEQDLE